MPSIPLTRLLRFAYSQVKNRTQSRQRVSLAIKRIYEILDIGQGGLSHALHVRNVLFSNSYFQMRTVLS